MKTLSLLAWACRLLAALILLQSLFFKFTGADESVELFTKLGAEPWGRIGTGGLELIASVLLLWPRRPDAGWTAPLPAVLGAGLALGLMGGAITSHLFVLGIESQGDGGQLFAYAWLVAIASAVLLLLHRRQLMHWVSVQFNRV
jgi:hypothetical protein